VSQARRRQRFNTPNQKRIGHGLREIVLISFCFMGLYLFLSLVTYSGSDPGIFHNGQGEELRNMGGVVGAFFSDLLFELFGYFAYLFPIMVVQLGWVIYQGRHHDILAEPRSLIIPGMGFILTLSAGCGLAIVHFTESPLPSHAGGMLGKAVGHSLQSMFSELGATLLLLALFFTGVTLLTGLSWLKLMDILGFHTLRLTPVVQKYLKQRFWPRFVLYSQQILQAILNFLKVLSRQLRRNLKRMYINWQTRRAEWQARREEYDADDYYDDDEEFIEESSEKKNR
jgi:S-DNA-T family DNA segregation ATPase FtsK/SpoIIIE